MDIRHLRSFLVLAEELHQGRAAARLGIEQPPLSRQIRELEEELGVQLFHRTTRSTLLSEAGEALLPHAKRIVSDERITRETVRAGWMASKRLRIGVSEGFVGAPIGALLRHLESEPSDIRTTLIERPMTDLITMLDLGTIDAIFAPEQAATGGATSLHAWTELLMALVPPHVGGRAPIGIAEFEMPLFLPDEMFLPGYARQLGALVPHDIPHAASRFASVTTLYALVGTGHGFGLLPHSLTIASERVSVRPIRSKRARIHFWLTTRKDDDTPAVVLLRAAAEAGLIPASPPHARDGST